MTTFDWVVLVATMVGIVGYGLYRSMGSRDVRGFLLAGKTMPWYAMGLSIMATQASAITFISTTGQAYVDGIRFVQFYFGLPIAMVILSATVVPAFHRANVYTAYQYLEKRFDLKTRTLVSIVFLIQRGLAVGIALYAPSIVLSVILGWSDQWTTVAMGVIVVFYTVIGGIKAVTWTEVQQMLIIFLGLVVALFTAVLLLPEDVSFFDAVSLAGALGKLNAVDTTWDPNNRYTLWSGLIGGTFLALAYFGTDQSQVQRYLTGKSIAQSRLSLLFNAVAKVPMQFLILFIGTMVFVFYLFEKPPLLFQPIEEQRILQEAPAAETAQLRERFDQAFSSRRQAARNIIEQRKLGEVQPGTMEQYREAQRDMEQVRTDGAALAGRISGAEPPNDTNYIFLSFVTRYMPAGVVGLILAAILAAAMSSLAAEINSLATVSVIDIYERYLGQPGQDRKLMWVSRLATTFWGAYAVIFAAYGQNLGTLIEAVNIVGSLFYGGMLGVFILAFGFPRVGGTGAFVGVLAGEAAIFYCFLATGISFLWYNLIGCVAVVAVGLAVSLVQPAPPREA